MCFGSAFIASNSSASFKVRKVYLTQHPESPFTIKISPMNATNAKSAQSSGEEEETVSNDVDGGEQQGDTSTATPAGIVYDRTYQIYKTGDYLGQRKSLSLTYDTNMKIDVYLGADTEGEHIQTFNISGIDEISNSELSKREGVSKPRVTLSFELTRSGILQLNKAEAKVDELYWVELPANKTVPKKEKKAPV